MIQLKPTVNPYHLQPEVLLLIQVVASVYAKHGEDCTITSLYDDAPGRLVNSLHRRDGLCRAVDFQTTHLSDTVRTMILAEVRTALGYDSSQPRAYDFFYEARITNPDGTVVKEAHCHGEYDPHFPLTTPPMSHV